MVASGNGIQSFLMPKTRALEAKNVPWSLIPIAMGRATDNAKVGLRQRRDLVRGSSVSCKYIKCRIAISKVTHKLPY